MGSRGNYTEADKLWFAEKIALMKSSNDFRYAGIKKHNLLELYKARFGNSIKPEGLLSTLRRIENPELAKAQYKKYKETAKLRKQGLWPPVRLKGVAHSNSNGTAELLSKYKLIIIIGDRVAGYENIEQVKEAIVNSMLPTDSMRMFEVKERKIKSQVQVEIE